MRLRVRLLVGLLAFRALAAVAAPLALLGAEERPSIFHTMSHPRPALEGAAVDGRGELPSMALYEALVAKLLPHLADKTIFFLARDMDSLRDAVEVVLYHSGVWPEMAPFARRLNLSRELARKLSRNAMRGLLERQGLVYADVFSGKLSLLLLDNGYRSKAFSRIFHDLCLALAEAKGSAADPVDAGMLFRQITPFLVSSHGSYPFPRVVSDLRGSRYRSLAQVCEEFRYHRDGERYAIRFPEFLQTQSELTAAGLPLDEDVRVGWLQDNWDRLNRHWVPRLVDIATDGHSLVYEGLEKKDSRVDRKMVIRTQLAIWDHFSRSDVLTRLLPLLTPLYTKLVAELGQWHAQPTQQSTGKLWKSGRGTVLELVEEASRDARIVVWKAKLRPSGRLVALKVLSDAGGDTAAIAADVRHTERLQKLLKERNLGAYVVPLLESGSDYVIKDWVSDVTGSQWLTRWQARGAPRNDPAAMSLATFVAALSAEGIYVRNLDPTHVGFSDGQLRILNHGGLNAGGDFTAPMDVAQARERYRQNFEERWGSQVSAPCQEALLRSLFPDDGQGGPKP